VRRVERPSEEGDLVVESELAVHVFNVVLRQQLVELVRFSVFRDIDVRPLKSIWQLERFFANLVDRLNYDRLVIHRDIEVLGKFRHWLGVPEDVLVKQWKGFVDELCLPLVIGVLGKDFAQ